MWKTLSGVQGPFALNVFQGQDVGKTDFNRRLLCMEKEIIGARNTKITQGLLDKTKEPFSVRIKPFWDLTAARKVWELRHEKTWFFRMRKAENKGADQLGGNHAADQHLCFRYLDITIHLLP